MAVMRTGRLYQKQSVQRLQSILGRLLKRQQRLACLYLLLIIIAYSLKEKERTDKKAAKVEKERKDKESQEKARSMMASFFGKPKPSTTSASSSKVPAPSGSTTLSEFDRVFKPFTLKKDVELAPTNWFQDAKRRNRFADADVIVIDDDGGDRDVEMIESEPSPDANTRRNIFFIWLLTIL
jgi:chromatin assembly factor 1 subunit A